MTTADVFLSGAKVYRNRSPIVEPKISVVMPTFARGADGLLRRSIETVLGQSFQEFELLVVDDGSTDGSSDIISDFVRKDSRVIHVRHDINSGLPALRVNEGLMLSRGEYCTYQFDDDQWVPDALSILFEQIERHPAYGLVYGRAKVKQGLKEWTIGGPFDFRKLTAANYIANNSVLHRRSLFERFGGYDMHLVMRRLCDWDLWLRWSQETAFGHVEAVVSYVEADLASSLGRTVKYDIFASRVHMSAARNELLRPASLSSYSIDGLDQFRALGHSKVAEIWQFHIGPFQSRHREIWPDSKPPKTPQHVLVVIGAYDTNVEITIKNFRDALRGDFQFTIIPLFEVDAAVLKACDVVVLVRIIDEKVASIVEIAHEQGKSVAFLLDDDLLSFHELSDEFSGIAPGQASRKLLEAAIRASDLVIAYSDPIRNSVSKLNKRVVVLKTNILNEHLASARRKASSKTSRSGQPIKVGFSGSGARRDEFDKLWPAIVNASSVLKEHAKFEFWGLIPKNVEDLRSPWSVVPFTYSYGEYLVRLKDANFDVMLSPLFGGKSAKLAKSPIKFLEITAAGAIGVFSKSLPYDVVVDDQTGLKCDDTVEDWTATILKAAQLSQETRDAMLRRALTTIDRDYTTERVAPALRATLQAALLHGAIRDSRNVLGALPRIAYFFHSPYLGGAEMFLLRLATLAAAFGFEPVVVLPESCSEMNEELQLRVTQLGMELAYFPLHIETEVNINRRIDDALVDRISSWFKHEQISIAHSVTLMREVGEAARKVSIPHVSSLFATNSVDAIVGKHCDLVHSDSFLYANRWSGVLSVPARRILTWVPDVFFAAADAPNRRSAGPLKVGIFGSVQARKGQLQSIEAVGLLKKNHQTGVQLHIFGYDHFFPEYKLECEAIIAKYDIKDQVEFHGFVRDPSGPLKDLDVVLCASDWESMPQAVLEGMASRKLIVTPLVGGLVEILSGSNGIVIPNNSAISICEGLAKAASLTEEELEEKVALAQRVAELETRKDKVALALFEIYHQAAERTAASTKGVRESHMGSGSANQRSRERLLLNALDKIRRFKEEGAL